MRPRRTAIHLSPPPSCHSSCANLRDSQSELPRGRVFVEVHDDIYGVVPWPWLLAQELVEEMGLERYVDRQRLEAVVEAASGIPTDVSYVNWPAEPISAPIEFDERGDPVGDYPPSPDSG